MPSPGLLSSQYPGMDAVASLAGVPLDFDQRTLQLAYDISRLNLQQNFHTAASSEIPLNMYGSALNGLLQRCGQPPSPTSAAAAALSVKRSQNMTECVPVPSSEHVAEIVGKQGCKIKALRSKTNTYIKTPVRGEEPVFVITGRREDVEIAKNEILQAADHFTQIRAQRRLHPPPHIPGQITIQMAVPLRLVGLIVGPKGQTIKKVQQDTLTYIITPGRDKDPVFEITGCQDGVNRARELVEDHVLSRTGSTLEELLLQQNDPDRQRLSSLDSGNFGMDIWKDNTDRLFSGGSPDNLSGGSSGRNDTFNFDIGCWNVPRDSPTPENNSNQFFSPSKQQRSFSIANPGSSQDPYDYGGVMESHRRVSRLNSDPMPAAFGASIWNGGSGSGGGGGGGGSSIFQTSPAPSGLNYFGSDFTTGFGMFSKSSLNSAGDSACSSSPAESITSQKFAKQCVICQDQDILAALVPCGHNLFCMGCAVKYEEKRCPICHAEVVQVLRIQSDV